MSTESQEQERAQFCAHCTMSARLVNVNAVSRARLQSIDEHVLGLCVRASTFAASHMRRQPA
jgi:hypothetical protein